MHTKDFILSTLGCDANVLEKCQEAFLVDIEDEDIQYTLKECGGNCESFGKFLLIAFWWRVIRTYDYLGLDNDKFGYDFNSPSYPEFYYGNESVTCSDDFFRLAK
jgi:hypothetical protein